MENETITPENGADILTRKNESPKKDSPRKKSNKKTPKFVKGSRNYPEVTLENCLIIAQKIKDINQGNPWAPREVSKAIKVASTSKFFYYTAASRDFGITIGTSNTKEITLTDFGRQLIYAPNPETEKAKKIEAFLKIPIFKDVLEYYKGNNLPEMKYLSNTLADKFKLPPLYHEEFSKIFKENCKYLNITTFNPSEYSSNDFKSNGNPFPSTIIVGETKKGVKGKLKAFVIMPFTERTSRPTGFFNEVLNSLIVPAGIDAEFTVETANRQGSDVIQSTIINDLLEADIVIADLTDHNPNVLFELGLRMHADKPVALIKSKDTGRIFDVDNMLRVFEYNPNLWKSTIETDIPELIEHIKAAWENRDSEQTYMKILRRGTVQ